MDFLTLIGKFESYTRNIVETRQGKALTYTGNMTSITINTNTTITDINRVCLLHDESYVYLYINHATRRNLTKYKLSDITSLVVA